MAKIHDIFKNRIQALQDYAAAVAASFRGTGPGKWAVPEDLSEPLVSPLSLTEPFNRDEINTEYGEVIKKAGTLGDVASLQRQIGFLATEERAMRMRYMSSARAAAMAHGQIDGHAHPDGVFGKVRIAAENLIKAGGTQPVSIGEAT